MQVDNFSSGDKAPFPFTLKDLAFWVIKRKDGTTAKFIIGNDDEDKTLLTRGTAGAQGSLALTDKSSTGTMSAYCHHNPVLPVFVHQQKGISLYCADSWGAKTMKNEFDIVLDAGDVFNIGAQDGLLKGDSALVQTLSKFGTKNRTTRILQIDWDDRAAPDLDWKFWPALVDAVSGDVLMNCQGGHGRTGTIFTCMMMVLCPDYNALDAMIHLRACHCPRAIESKVQHEYINYVAKGLGREQNALDAIGVKDYKAAFDAMKNPSAVGWQAYVKKQGWEKK